MPKTYEELLGFKKMQKISLERLTPPMAPKPIASEKSGIDKFESGDSQKAKGSQRTDSRQSIDPFVWLSSNHSFQMVLYEFMKKFAPGLEKIKTRGTKTVLKNSFSRARQDLMKELKQVLEMRNK